jgi:molecular chaperone IbpA
VRELPEILKPRKIEIGSATAAAPKAKAKVVEADAANDSIEAA